MIVKTKCYHCGLVAETEIVDITDWWPYICDECFEKLKSKLKEVNTNDSHN